MPFRNIPIRRKLMVIILLTTVSALLLIRSVFFTYEFLTFRQTIIQQLSIVGEVIAANSTAALAFDNQDDAKETLAALEAEPHVTAAALYDKDGKIFATYPVGVRDDLLPALPGSAGYHYQRWSLVGFQPVIQGTLHLGTLYMKLDTGTIMRQWFRNSIALALAVLAIVVLVAYLISRTLQKQISQPILSLAETAKAISDRQDYAVRATKFGADELGLLTDAFNKMLGQIQGQDIALREKEQRLRIALQAAQSAEEEVRQSNQELEQRVARRTAQLEEANKELASFSYSVSHDLRSPLRGIDGFCHALEEDYADKLDETGSSHLARVRAATHRMGELIDDLLKLSQIARADLHRQTVDLSGLAWIVVRELHRREPQRHVQCGIAGQLSAEADPRLVRVALENLLGNAWKFTGKRADAQIEFGQFQRDGQTVFFVRDNGAGFDMAYNKRLFGAFQRLHNQDEFEGTGIGLATVQRIVNRHGGRVWAEGEIDKGATFYFTL